MVKKGRVFYGQEPPSGESTTTECGGQLSTTLQYSTEVAQLGTPSCSRQPAKDNGVRDGWSNWLVAPTLMGSTPWAPRIARFKCGLQIAGLAAATGARTHVHAWVCQANALPVQPTVTSRSIWSLDRMYSCKIINCVLVIVFSQINVWSLFDSAPEITTRVGKHNLRAIQKG